MSQKACNNYLGSNMSKAKTRTVEIKDEAVTTHETWVKGEITKKIEFGDKEYGNPRLSNAIEVTVHAKNDGEHSFDIRRNLWVSLNGSIGDYDFVHTDLLDHNFTMAELRLISATLVKFIDGVDSGEISPR